MVKKDKDGLTSATVRKKIKIQLINQDFILISIAAEFRTPDFLSMLRELGGVYNQDFRGHVYMKENYDQLVDGVKKMLQSKGQTTGIIDGIPKCAIDYVRPMPSEFIFKLNTSINDLPKEFVDRLYSFQKEGIQFGLRRFGRLLIADEMGVGKTIQALGLCALYRSEWPVLIICPSSLKYNWKSEALEWLPMFLHSEEIQILNKSSDAIYPGSKFIIMSYDLAKKQSEDLAKMRFKIAICDEAHYLKNPMSKRSEEITPILKTSKRVLMLTGTPALAKPRELFPVLSCIRPDVYTEFKEFGKRYCCPMINRFTKKMEYDGADNMEELNFILKTVMIRRLKKDVLSELPWKTRQIVQIKTSAKEIKQIEKLISELESQGNKIDQIISQMGGDHNGARPGGAMPGLAGRDENDRNKVLTIATRCFELSAHAKLEGVIEFLTDLEAYDEKLVVFAHHQYMLDGLEAFTQSRKKGYIRIDGRVDSMARGKLVERFQTDPTVKYALLAITAASVGITLTASNTVIFAELHWTPANVIQAEDRCHRITQKKNVMCYYLHGEKTLDTQMFSIIKKKFETTSKILDGENAQLLNIDREIQAGDIVNQRDLDELDDLELDLDLKPSKQGAPSTAIITDIDDELADLDLQLIETKPSLTSGSTNTQPLPQAQSPGIKSRVSVAGFRKTGAKPKPKESKQSLDVLSDSDGENKPKSRIGRVQKLKKSAGPLVDGDEAIMIDENPNTKIEAELDDIEEIVEKQGGGFFVKDKQNTPVSARTGLTAQQKEVKKKAKAQQKRAAAAPKKKGRGKQAESSGEDSDNQDEIFENALEDIDDEGDELAAGSDDNLDEGEDDEDMATNLFGKQPIRKPGDPDDDIEVELDDLEISALLAAKNARATQAVEQTAKFGSSSSPNQVTTLKTLLGAPKPSNPLLGHSSPVSQQQQSSSSLFNTAKPQLPATGPRAALLLNPNGRGVVNPNKTTVGSILSNGRLASASAQTIQSSPLAGKAVSALSTQEKLQMLKQKMQQKPTGKKGGANGQPTSKGKSVGKGASGGAKVISLDDEPVQMVLPRKFSATSKGGKGKSVSKDKKSSLLVGKKPKEVPMAFTELHTREMAEAAPISKFFAQGGPHSPEEGRYVKGPLQPQPKHKGCFKPKGRVKPN